MSYRRWLILLSILLPVAFCVTITLYDAYRNAEAAVVQPVSSSVVMIRLPARKAVKVTGPRLSAHMEHEDLAILFHVSGGEVAKTYNQYLAAETLARRNGYTK